MGMYLVLAFVAAAADIAGAAGDLVVVDSGQRIDWLCPGLISGLHPSQMALRIPSSVPSRSRPQSFVQSQWLKTIQRPRMGYLYPHEDIVKVIPYLIGQRFVDALEAVIM